MEISASAVKELRERTGAGMMDCKNALAENGGNVEKAIDYLREKGLPKLQKRPPELLQTVVFSRISTRTANSAL